MASQTLQAGDLTAVIGDNSAAGSHRAGYNGIWDLRHRASERNLFVPSIAGMNLEHIFNGEPMPAREVFFEPRHAPMNLRRISDTEVELHQPPTPTFHLESWTRFKLAAPHYIDFSFRCTAHQHVFGRGWIGLFWASYINAPDDKSLYFLGGDESRGAREYWSQLCTPRHNVNSTVRQRGDSTELEFSPDMGDSLFRNYSPFRFDAPFHYGNFDSMTWLLMFDRGEGIRFTHSPSGGGANPERRTTNPAWDFQFIVPNAEILTEYGFKARAVYRPRCTREEIEEEYRRWM